MTPQIVSPGDASELYLIAPSGRIRLGGSVLLQAFSQMGGECPDVDDASKLAMLFEKITDLNRRGLISAYHDRSDGGVLVALLEMAFAGRCGLDLQIEADDVTDFLFAEEIGCVVQIADKHVETVLADLDGLHVVPLGQPRGDQSIGLRVSGQLLFESDRSSLQRIWSETSYQMSRLRDDPGCADEEFELVGGSDQGLSARLTFDPSGEDRSSALGIHTSRPRIAIVREQGVNGHIEMAAAFDRAGFDAVDVHMSDLMSGEVDLAEFPAMVACGGFSYGDVLGGGGGWAKRILYHSRLRDSFQSFFESDRLALGICNGCQMMANLKDIIPGASSWPRFVRNRSEQFEGRTVMLRINANTSPWLEQMAGSVIPVPVAHGEGRAEFDGDHEARLWADSSVPLQYVDGANEPTEIYPLNPNGAVRGLAGVTGADGRVLIMMPHPERVYRSVANVWQDPTWSEDGPWMKLFRNAYVSVSG
jgi:phosphoribosylformylglycinamidine synthase